jgi:hypothetical protein
MRLYSKLMVLLVAAAVVQFVMRCTPLPLGVLAVYAEASGDVELQHRLIDMERENHLARLSPDVRERTRRLYESIVARSTEDCVDCGGSGN